MEFIKVLLDGAQSSTKTSLKGMVHMITMLTYIPQIDIEDYKTLLNVLIQPWLPCFGIFLNPKNKLEIPKMMPDNPNFFA